MAHRTCDIGRGTLDLGMGHGPWDMGLWTLDIGHGTWGCVDCDPLFQIVQDDLEMLACFPSPPGLGQVGVVSHPRAAGALAPTGVESAG